MKIAGIIVAAGRASRFGGANKLLAMIDGKPLIRHVIDAAIGAALDGIVVVLPQNSPELFSAASGSAWRTVVNENAADGLSSSIRCGLAAIDPESDGALILLADMPRVTPCLIKDLSNAFAARKAQAIVFPQTLDGRQGNPVLWPRALFPDLIALTGDTGGKALLRAHPDLHATVETNDNAAFFDVDTRADLEQLKDGKH